MDKLCRHILLRLTVCRDTKGGFSKSSRTLTPVSTYKYHHATVNDVDHHAVHQHWIGTVSDDLSWKLIDTREAPSSKPARDVANAHTDAINSIAFHPDPDYNMLVATGSADKSIGLWDLRNTEQKIHSFEFHRHEVISLQWHPHSANILASSSNDRRICFWDLGDVGKEQTPEEAEDGPPEL
jgi:histone-binding protein RBBP4